MKSTVIDKYLARYAEPEARDVPATSSVWRHVVCIPACDEADNLLCTLQGLCKARQAESSLVVVVVNGREAAPAEVHASNAKTLAQLRAACGASPGVQAWGDLQGMGVLVVDRATQDRWLPRKQGVGLARKIAGDIALALIRRGSVRSEWIRCTDADVQVPLDYFDGLDTVASGASAAITAFVHVPEGGSLQQAAMRHYDAYLQSYVDGLEAAGSPYAFHTIGSLISVHAQSYAVVRGIPKRLAGEDFYLLNKLAKVGRVVTLVGEPVRIRGRHSDRVPFGTGAALREIEASLARGGPVRNYPPVVFEGVRHWLQALDRFVEDKDVQALREQVRSAADPLGSVLVDVLDGLGAFEAVREASEQVSGAHLKRRLMEWNDAFRTLKLVHGIRDATVVQRPQPDGVLSR